MNERKFTYEDGYEDGIESGKDECIDILKEMDLEKYDYNTICAAIQMIKGEEVTYDEYNTKEVSIEIEHYDGDTYLAFMLAIAKNGSVKVTKTSGCNHADTDGDYIFETDNGLIRIQADKPISKDKCDDIWNCYNENEEE